jgi:hypothetical protein
MTDPIFVKVRNDEGEIYQSYSDYWTLVELSGFSTIELDEVNPNDGRTYIFTPNNGNVEACCRRPHKSRYILWNLEIPIIIEGFLKSTVKCPDYFDEMWVSCRYFHGISPNKTKFVPLGGHIGLYKEPVLEKRWDFCHIAYIYGKRLEQVQQLESRGFTMAPIGWGDIRDESIACSRWGLCLHQNPVPALSPQRMTLFACRKLPIVIEKCDPYPYQAVLLDDFLPDKDYTEIVDKNFEMFTDKLSFRNCVEEGLCL